MVTRPLRGGDTPAEARRKRYVRVAEKTRELFERYKTVLILERWPDTRTYRALVGLLGKLQIDAELFIAKHKVMKRAIEADDKLQKHVELFCALKKFCVEKQKANDSRCGNDRLQFLGVCNSKVTLLFLNEPDLSGVISRLESLHTWYHPRAGDYAPVNIVSPRGPTDVHPYQTPHLAAFGIASRIVKGRIELANEVLLCRKGERITQAVARHCYVFNVSLRVPAVRVVYLYSQGHTFDVPHVIFMPDYEVIDTMHEAVRLCAQVSRICDTSSKASAGFSLAKAFSSMLSISRAIDYQMEDKSNERTAFEIRGTVPFEFDWSKKDKLLFS